MQGHVAFGKMEEVIFGTPVGEAVPALVGRLGAKRVFIMCSGTLNRETNAVSDLAATLGDKVAGLFDQMPAHTPREAVIAATRAAREAGADLILTFGGGSVTDGAKAVQLCLANDIDDAASLLVAAGEKGHAGRAADRGIGVEVGEEHPLLRHLFDVGGLDPPAIQRHVAATADIEL